MPYVQIEFANAPSTATPLNAANLNQMDQGIMDAHNAIDAMQPDLLVSVVPLNTAWKVADGGVGLLTSQVFYSKFGAVRSPAVYSVSLADEPSTNIMVLPEHLRPSYTAQGIAYAQITGAEGLMPTLYTIDMLGNVMLPVLPPADFTLIMEFNYFL